MNKKQYSKLQAALKNQSPLKISEDHLAETIQLTRIAYKNRRQRERIGYGAFLLRQVRFVGVPVWLLQGAALFFMLWFLGAVLDGDVRYVEIRHLPPLLCSFAAMIAMPGIPLIGRSAQYRMLEMEMATRISLRRLLLARLLIVSAGGVLALGIALLLINAVTELTAGSILVYLLLPYLIVCCGGMFIQSRAHDQSPGFIYTAFCFFFIALLFALYQISPQVYEQAMLGVWGALCAIFAAVLFAELRGLLKKAGFIDLFPAEV